MVQKSGFVGRLQKSMSHGGQACRVLHSFLEAQHTTCITNSTASKDLPATISRTTSLLKTLRRRRSSSRSFTQTPQLSLLKLKLSTKHSPTLDQSRSLSCECLPVHRAPFGQFLKPLSDALRSFWLRLLRPASPRTSACFLWGLASQPGCALQPRRLASPTCAVVAEGRGGVRPVTLLSNFANAQFQ